MLRNGLVRTKKQWTKKTVGKEKFLKEDQVR